MSVAVFVDAGYLKKAGLAAVTGSSGQPLKRGDWTCRGLSPSCARRLASGRGMPGCSASTGMTVWCEGGLRRSRMPWRIWTM